MPYSCQETGIASLHSSKRLTNMPWVECPGRKPNCGPASICRVEPFKHLHNYWQYWWDRSKVGHTSTVSPLGTGVTCADFHSSGVFSLFKLLFLTCMLCLCFFSVICVYFKNTCHRFQWSMLVTENGVFLCRSLWKKCVRNVEVLCLFQEAPEQLYQDCVW